jgi:hypothetical protein
MTIFEMVFNLIGIVLGLALVEVLGGLAETIKSRRSRGQLAHTAGRTERRHSCCERLSVRPQSLKALS